MQDLYGHDEYCRVVEPPRCLVGGALMQKLYRSAKTYQLAGVLLLVVNSYLGAGELLGKWESYRDARQAIVAYKPGHQKETIQQLRKRKLGPYIKDVYDKGNWIVIVLPPKEDMGLVREIASWDSVRYVEPDYKVRISEP
jgi:hypothetical protein